MTIKDLFKPPFSQDERDIVDINGQVVLEVFIDNADNEVTTIIKKLLNKKWQREHGEVKRWIEDSGISGMVDIFICPDCDQGFTNDFNYCPSCGVKLDPLEEG